MCSLHQDPIAMHVKGSILRSRFLYVALNHGAMTWERIVARLPAADREAVEDIVVDDWYSLAALDRLDTAISDEFGDGEQVWDKLGEFSATTSLTGPYSSLLIPDIHSFLAQSALIHRAYQDFGSAAYGPLSETSGLLTINYDVPPPASFCPSGAGYFRRAIELCGARSARITHTRCTARGDSVCEFYITWQ